jgi:glycosyltransferase involved in cell wall biosynthesis
MADGMAPDTSSKADIAMVIADLGAGGAQRVMVTLANIWADRGYRICIVTLADTGQDFYPLAAGINRIRLSAPQPSASPLAAALRNGRRILALRQALADTGAGTVIAFITATNILAVLASLGMPWRLTISERNDPDRQPTTRLWHNLRRLLYRFADNVTANSESAVRSLARYVPQHKLHRVHNPVAQASAGEAPASHRNETILAVGRLAPQKAFDVLIEAFARFAPDHPQWRLKIAGEGALSDTLKALAARLGIAEKIDWLGRVENMPPVYHSAAIFALPSRFEGVPNALLEAMSHGCACIVSDASEGPLELVEKDASGLVVRVDDAEALAQAMRRLADDPALRLRLASAAVARISANDSSHVADDWLAMLGLRPVQRPS